MHLHIRLSPPITGCLLTRWDNDWVGTRCKRNYLPPPVNAILQDQSLPPTLLNIVGDAGVSWRPDTPRFDQGVSRNGSSLKDLTKLLPIYIELSPSSGYLTAPSLIPPFNFTHTSYFGTLHFSKQITVPVSLLPNLPDTPVQFQHFPFTTCAPSPSQCLLL